MGNLIKFREQILVDGRITSSEVENIKSFMAADGQLDVADARLLVELMRDADEVCCEFDEMFFPLLRHIILEDGRVGIDEQFVLLQMLYSDGEVRPAEKRFLSELYRDVEEASPEFRQLCETALNCHEFGWDEGGV